MTEEYELQFKFITRRHVEAESPEEATEKVPVDSINPDELDIFKLDIIDEDGHVVSQDHYSAAFGD